MSSKLQDLMNTENMSSLAIARRFNKDHNEVCRDIEKQFKALEKDITPFVNLSPNGLSYNLNFNSYAILVAGYDPKLLIEILDRSNELERQIAEDEEIIKEGNLITNTVFGMTTEQLLQVFDATCKNIRKKISKDENDALIYVEKLNVSLYKSGVPFEDRVGMLKNSFTKRFKGKEIGGFIVGESA